MQKRALIVILSASLLLAACSGGSSSRRVPDMPSDNKIPTGANGGVKKVGNPYKIAGKTYYPKDEPAYDEVGIASWYGKQFHGKLTANGETYNMNALTAAHKTLAMPTFVKVTNLSNKRSIIVRVNDRGPFVGDRIIDMSRRAAQVLGFSEQGTTRVRVQGVDKKGRVISKKRRREIVEEQAERAQAPIPSGSVVVMAGSFRDRDNALMRVRDLKNAGLEPRIVTATVNGLRYYRVAIGSFNSRGSAEKLLDKVQDRGFYDARVVTID